MSEINTREAISGEILGRDLYTNAGVLLLKKGSKLTPNLKKRIRNHCIEKIFVYPPLDAA